MSQVEPVHRIDRFRARSQRLPEQRRSRTPRLALGLALGLAAGCAQPAPRGVLLVTLDTIRADHLKAFGGCCADTPALDALAAESSVYLQASAQVPITTPSHATILTGLLPPAHGVRDNGNFALPPTADTLAERLARQGFASHAVLSSFALDRRFGLDQGFGGYDDAIAAGAANPRAERRAGVAVDLALAWLQSTHEPFFLWLHLYDPHDPYQPPPPFDSRYRDRPYDGEIAYMDQELGRLLAALRATGRLERTLVIVVGDHGEGLGDHGERLHGTLLFDSTLRVPLLVRWPGKPRPRRVEAAAGTHDIVPTVLSALALPADPVLPGRDLRSLGEQPGDDSRRVYAESLTAELHYGWSRQSALRDQRFKLLRGVGSRLYDHRSDPGESRDVSALEPALVAALEVELGAIETGSSAAPTGIDPESAEKLAALGYVSPGGSSAGARAIDPVTAMDIEELLLQALDAEASDPPRARAGYLQALARDPELKLALLRLGELEERLGNPQAALAHAQTLLARYPDVEPAWSLTLRVLTRSARWQEARAAVEAALGSLPRSAGLHLDHAVILRILGDRDGARRAAEWVAPSAPERPRAAWLLAALAADRGEQGLALRLLAEARRGGQPPDPRVLAREPAFASMREDPEFQRLASAEPAGPGR